MAINFNENRWDNVAKRFDAWWDGKATNALTHARVRNIEPTRSMPSAPFLTQATCADLSFSPKQLIDRADYELSQYTFIGDAFPHLNLDCFGPGVVAAFLGANLDNSSGRVWFSPKNKVNDITELNFTYDNTNAWLQRILEICHEGTKLWKGDVVISMPDLGGILDILATFIESENLLFELYDHPEEVKRLSNQLVDLWLRFYKDINDILAPNRRGYSDWSLIFSSKPSYIIQSDFSFMISPDMFNEFVKPEITKLTENIDNTIYHLDGTGQLGHVDHLLSIDTLNAIQWIPGDGAPSNEKWPELYRKIIDGNKGLMTYGNLEQAKKIISDLGSPRGVYHNFTEIPNNPEYIKQIETFCEKGI